MDCAGRKRAAVVLCVLAGLCPCAFALNPSLDINQYAHKSWTIRDGFFKGIILSIAQTEDGYLWLGTQFGLLRFDGVRAVEWRPPGSEHLPDNVVNRLLTGRDGTLWIGTAGGVASWKDGALTHYPELDGKSVWSMLEDRGGTVWAGGSQINSNGWLCAIRGGKPECHGQDGSLGTSVNALYEDRPGDLWVGAGSGLWRWRPGPPTQYPIRDVLILSLIDGEDGKLLIGTNAGLVKLVNGKVEPYRLPGFENLSYFALRRDHNGALWIGTRDGLIHLHRDRTDGFSRLSGLSSEAVTSLFEDREGSLWVSTAEGLDRFRELPVIAVASDQGLSAQLAICVLAARDGSVWLSSLKGLDRWEDGRVTSFHKMQGLPDDAAQSLFQDDGGRIWTAGNHGLAWFNGVRFVPVTEVSGGNLVFAGQGDELWISHPRGLLRLRDGHVVEEFPWARFGSKQRAWGFTADRQRGGLWLGFLAGGVAYFKDGLVRNSYTPADGLGNGRVWNVQIDSEGTVWASTDGGLSMIRQKRIATLNSKSGLPCDTVHWRLEDNDGATWLYMPCGLVRIARGEMDGWKANPKYTVRTAVFDGSDGVRLHPTPFAAYRPLAAKSADGKLWFVAGAGISVIDPRHLPLNKLPPPVHIEQVIADRQVVTDRRLPAHTRDVSIEYTALSLVAPEKNRFKYMLEGYDRDWVDAGNRRQAFYTNLSPRKYRFHVIACNNSGVWNEAGDTLEFSIAPTFWQTNWFKAACVAGFVVLIWLGYQLRLRQVQREARRLREVIETIPANVWSAQPDGSVDFVNGRLVEFTGLPAEQLLGWGWADAVHAEDRGRLDEAWRGAVAAGKAMEVEARMRSADGTYRWLSFRSVPLRNGSGKIVKWYGKSTDIEDSKRARQLESDMAHVNRVSMMGELAASVAHEVNQPLTGIVSNGSAGLRIASGAAPDLEEIRDTFADIVRDGKRAGQVIARIRAMTKRATTPKERQDLNEVIREVLVLVTDEAKRNRVVIKTRFADDLAAVSGDRVQLQQVVLNLAINAIQAMGSVEGRARELVMHTRNVDGDQVQVTVEDKGVGLDPNVASNIFDAFFTTKSGGMGMGLSICRSIVQSHGGRLWATANEGPGASFHFALPKHKDEESSVEAGAD